MTNKCLLSQNEREGQRTHCRLFKKQKNIHLLKQILKNKLTFRAVLGSQQNWVKGSEISHVHSPSGTQPQPLSTSYTNCVFVTADETELMPQCHPGPQFTLGVTLGGVHSMGVYAHVTCVYEYSVTE